MYKESDRAKKELLEINSGLNKHLVNLENELKELERK